MALAEKQEQAVLTLANKGYYSKVRAMQLQREMTSVRGEIAEADAMAAGAIAGLSSDQAKLEHLQRDRKAELLDNIAGKSTELAQVTAAMQQLRNQLLNLSVPAPVSGYVEKIQINTIGQSVSPGQELMHIVPDDGLYMVDVLVNNDDIGRVTQGQQVTLKIEAYDYQRYGMLAGSVQSIATDSSRDEATGAERFVVQVRTEGNVVGGNPAYRIHSGMLAVADFHVGTRTIVSYLINAVGRVRDEAFRQ